VTTPDQPDSLTHILQRLTNDDRLHSERTASFLLANSFLLAGYALLRQDGPEGIQFVPIFAALVFAFLHLANINYGEVALHFWYEKLRELSPVQSKLEERFNSKIWLRSWAGKITRKVGSCGYPLLFLGMWFVLLGFEVLG